MSGSFVKSLLSVQYGIIYYWCRLHRLIRKCKIHQIKYVLYFPKFIEHSLYVLSAYTCTKRIHTHTSLESKDPRAQSLSSISNCVRNSLFYDSVFQLKIRNTSPTFGNGCIQSLRSFFNYMTSSCAQTGEMLLLFHSVMSVNVFVWVLSRADECVSNRMHLKMISQSHKWENNSHRKKVRYFHIVFLFVRNHNHIMRDNRRILFIIRAIYRLVWHWCLCRCLVEVVRFIIALSFPLIQSYFAHCSFNYVLIDF